MKTNTFYIFIVSLGTFLVLSTGVLFMHFQIQNKVKIVQDFYKQQKQNSNLELGKSLGTKISDRLQEEELIKKGFLTEESIVSFVGGLENVARINGSELNVEKIQEGKKSEITKGITLKPITFDIVIKGDYENIKKVAQYIQSTPELVMIDDFKLYKNYSNEEGENQYEYNVRGVLSANILRYENN